MKYINLIKKVLSTQGVPKTDFSNHYKVMYHNRELKRQGKNKLRYCY